MREMRMKRSILVELLPLLCNPNLDYVKEEIKKLI